MQLILPDGRQVRGGILIARRQGEGRHTKGTRRVEHGQSDELLPDEEGGDVPVHGRNGHTKGR